MNDDDTIELTIAAAIHDQAMGIMRMRNALVEAGAYPGAPWQDAVAYQLARDEAVRIVAGRCAGGEL